MISYIHVKNIAIIEEEEIEFKNGLNVLTGETGVGKSIIINAINFALGAKVSKDIIRKGAESASCEVIFSLDEKIIKDIENQFEIEIEEDLIVSRTLNQTGKNIYKINGVVTTSNIVKELTSKIIDIHGQHEHQSLFNVKEHINILDKFALNDVEGVKQTLREKYVEYKEVTKRIQELLGNDNDRERRIDILTYEISEISEAKLKLGEEEELLNRHEIIMCGDKILSSASKSIEALEISKDNISKSIKEFEKIEKYDQKINEYIEMLKEAEILVSEAKSSTIDYVENINYDSTEQQEVEERLDKIDKLKRKYGNTIQDIIDYMNEKNKELSDIVNSESILEELKNKKQRLSEVIIDLCTKLSILRKQNADNISKKIEKNLKDLEMKNAKFEIIITKKEEFTENGFDNVEFMFSSNLGEEVKQLSKIASGGEVSRVMLAIKNVIADTDEIGTLIFDEIDTGISGHAAQKVAEKMSELSVKHQIICITHLPQIAAMADNNYKIVKEEKEGRTLSNINILGEDEQIKEIARLVAGVKLTDSAIMHAKEMKQEADLLKKQA